MQSRRYVYNKQIELCKAIVILVSVICYKAIIGTNGFVLPCPIPYFPAFNWGFSSLERPKPVGCILSPTAVVWIFLWTYLLDLSSCFVHSILNFDYDSFQY